MRRQLEEFSGGRREIEGVEMQVEQMVGKKKGVTGYDDAGKVGDPLMVVYSPQFNSGAFAVPWTETEAKIQEVFRGWDGEWFILAPPK